MNAQIQSSFVRLQTYVARAQLATQTGNPIQALADVAEISEIARRLWNELQKEVNKQRS
jgi:hypothetical protein